MRNYFKLARGIVLRPTEGGYQVLRGRYRQGRSTGLFAFPGGQVEAGETTLEAAIREVWEETGVHTTNLFRRQPPIQVCPLNAGNMVIQYHVLVETGGTPRDSAELDYVAFVTPDSMLAKHANGKRPFMAADLQAWEKMVEAGLRPGDDNFYPRFGKWPGYRIPRLRLPALPTLRGGESDAEPANA